MKKTLLASAWALFASASLNAQIIYNDTSYMTFKYGLTNVSSDFSLNQHSFGFDLIGEMGNEIKPKLDFSYISIDEVDSADFLFQTSINAFYKSLYGYQNIIPYMYGGLGYEYVGNSHPNFDSSFYVQEGFGLEIPISQPSDDLHLVTEIRFMQLIGADDGQDNEIAIFLGLRLPISNSFSFGNSYSATEKSAPTANYPEFMEPTAPDSVANKYMKQESDYNPNDIVEDKTTSKNTEVVTTDTSVNYDGFADTDGDGVPDNIDICPNTPKTYVVNKKGCPLREERGFVEKKEVASSTLDTSSFRLLPVQRKILDIHFRLNSATVEPESKILIRDFVNTVNNTKYNKIRVEGYTDNTGSYAKNYELSQRRADAVKKLMIEYGIDSSRISAIGKGPLSPIATNETEEGRALNRRIEIVVE